MPHQLIARVVSISLLVIALITPAAMADKGPNGGQLIDAAEKYHLELVVSGQELKLFVSDLKDNPISTQGASAKATVLSAGGKAVVDLKPAGPNVLGGSGAFGRSKSMKVDVSLSLPGMAPIVGKFTPFADAAGGSHAGHKH